MTLDKRITVGNILTMISFFVAGLVFVLTTQAASVRAVSAVSELAPRVEINESRIEVNADAIALLQNASVTRGEDMEYLTEVVRAIAVAVKAEIPIKSPSK